MEWDVVGRQVGKGSDWSGGQRDKPSKALQAVLRMWDLTWKGLPSKYKSTPSFLWEPPILSPFS